MGEYFCYLVRCSDGSLYAGSCRDLQARLAVHNSGKGAKYTRSRLPVELVYSEEFTTKSEALKREAALKKLRRADKLLLLKK